jgi:tetratricopeptide (TPR) repeat protein
MKRMVFAALFALALAGLAFAQAAQATQFPALEPDPRALGFAGWGQYSWEDVGEIALWASSVGASGAADGAAQMARVKDGVAELLAAPDLPADARARGEFVLSFVHQKFLRGYVENQTRVDEIFRTGRYNCVSSAVLYAVFAAAAGLDVRGVMTKDHAFATVNIGGALVDVETTNRYGFDPGNRKEFRDGAGSVTGFAYVPARNYRDRTAISQLELVSLILGNRISELEKRNRYAEAVPLAINRAVLLQGRRDPVSSPFFTDPQKDLMDRLLNYGSSLMKAGREDAALQWAALASARYPNEARWQEFVYAALNNLMVKHLRSHRIAEARNALEANAALLSRGNYARLEPQVLDAELVQRSQSLRTAGDAQALLLAVDDARSRGAIAESRARELRDFAVLKEAERLSSAHGPREAVAYLEAAIARYGRTAQIESAIRVYRGNRLAELHNAFAALYNRRDYEGADRHIRAALEEFPEDRQLAQDLGLVEKALRDR